MIMEAYDYNSTFNPIQEGEGGSNNIRPGSAKTVSSTESEGSQSSEKLEIKAEASWGQRVLSWVTLGLFKPSSSYDKGSFVADLNARYGPGIAAKVMSFEGLGLSKKSAAWNPVKLELATVAKARGFAEFLETSELGNNELATSETAVLRAEKKQYLAAAKVISQLEKNKTITPETATAQYATLHEKIQGIDDKEVAARASGKTLTIDEAVARIKTTQKAIKSDLLKTAYGKNTIMESASKAIMKNVNPTANFLLKPLIATKAIKKLPVQLEKESKIEALFKKKQIEVRNEQPWDPIKASVTTTRADETKVINNTTITPASNFMKIEDASGKALGGICSGNNDNPDHAVNLCVDRLHAPEGSPEGSLDSLIIVRGGVDVLPSKVEEVGIDGKVSKKTIEEIDHAWTFNKRFDEGLVACLESKGQLHDVAEGEEGSSENNPIELDVADLGFLSQFDEEETAMQTRQFEMLDKVTDQPRQITYKDPKDPSGAEKKIWVKPKITAFNFGVEWGDRGNIGEKKLPSAWRAKNEASLNALEDKAGKWINNNSGHNDVFIVMELKNQIKMLRTAGKLYSNSDDYYDVAARVILLSHKLGMIPKIHCKSGKDRTSRAIEAAKALAIEIQNSPKTTAYYKEHQIETGHVPAPIPATREQNTFRKKVGFNSGNQGIQELNTDFRGNKQYSAFGFMEGLSYLGSKVAGYTTKAVTEYKGLSDLAKR